MNREDKIAVVERLHLLWNTGDLALVPTIYKHDFVAHMPKGWERSEFVGHAGVKDAILRIRNAFTNWHEVIEDIIVEDDKVVTRYISTGIHTGDFIGLAPTGKSIQIDEMSIYRLENGLVAEQWCLTDDLTLNRQLGRM